MSIRLSRAIGPLLATGALLTIAPPLPGQTIQDSDLAILEKLRSRNRAATDTFALASQASEAGRHEHAAALYGRVTELVPDLPDAWRRRGGELLATDRRTEAIASLRTAVNLERSVPNLRALVIALTMPLSDGEQDVAAV